MVADSALAPWQKLKYYETILNNLKPFLSRDLSSGKRVKRFLRLGTITTDNSATRFFYANSEVGALAIGLRQGAVA